jgi:hypothetical protein
MEKWNDGCQTENSHCEHSARIVQDGRLEVETSSNQDSAVRTRRNTATAPRQAHGHRRAGAGEAAETWGTAESNTKSGKRRG